MNRLIFILLLLSNITFAQTKEKFLRSFLIEDVLDTKNILSKSTRFDFSNLWTQTENNLVFGFIGAEHQRIKIKLTSIQKSPANPTIYFVLGKSNVKGIICDFSGTIKLTEIKNIKELHFGVDDEYRDKGVKSQGILFADYEFKENPNLKNSGIFKGLLYTKWYLNSGNQIKYDDIGLNADGYMNNAFVGSWKDYSSDKEKKCNWGDFRVPQANQDFDIGVGDFFPSKKYNEKGWENYHKAMEGDEVAKNEELKEWWK